MDLVEGTKKSKSQQASKLQKNSTFTLFIPTLSAAAAALLKGLFIWLDHRLTVRLRHLTGSGPDGPSAPHSTMTRASVETRAAQSRQN